MNQYISCKVVVGLILLSCSVLIVAQSPSRACFQFTWLGPQFNNESVFMNATCQDAVRLASGVPCREPLVVSENGTWPNMNYIWTNHRQQATCVPAANDVCATFTYYFNGHVENATYMCTRAVDSSGNAISRGCFEQRNGSFVTRACFCQSVEGGLPCNNATLSNILSFTAFLLAMTVTIIKS
ncbi:unnamed protein product [Diatraea saccharalis]|uniref:Uncharacterized protein n=1 Tax=Diatraea saccharalis TaxID=40085 RepID=A0A9N9R9X8_9NEOP|nr:unnamed protein product [Diatraea saccharalis]